MVKSLINMLANYITKMKIIFIMFFLGSILYSQHAYEPQPENYDMRTDSLNYMEAKKLYAKGYNTLSKNRFTETFSGRYNKWCDSVKLFLQKIDKSNWLSGVNQDKLRGYSYNDSLYFENGKQLFIKEDWIEARNYFSFRQPYDIKNSIYYDSVVVLLAIIKPKTDSLLAEEKQSRVKMERKWVYLGLYDNYNKYGEYTGLKSCYYDENHLLFEADSVCILTKNGNSEYNSDYRYVSLNLNTRIVHGIDASFIYSGKSYNYVWDGDWWKENSGLGDDLYNEIKKYIK